MFHFCSTGLCFKLLPLSTQVLYVLLLVPSSDQNVGNPLGMCCRTSGLFGLGLITSLSLRRLDLLKPDGMGEHCFKKAVTIDKGKDHLPVATGRRQEDK